MQNLCYVVTLYLSNLFPFTLTSTILHSLPQLNIYPSSTRNKLQQPPMAPPTDLSCGECDQTFSSAQARHTHQLNVDHAVYFTCAPCEKRFAAKNAFAKHKKRCGAGKVRRHTPRVDEGMVMARQGGKHEAGPQVQKPHGQKSQVQKPQIQKVYQEAYTANCTEANDCDLHDLDWGLCDKDCGWCGHCLDNYDGDI
jgi:hypothetical protein